MTERRATGQGRNAGQGEELAGEQLLDTEDWELDDEAFEVAWDAAREDAIKLLRGALPEVRDLEPPRGALAAAAGSLRVGLARRGWIYTHMRRAAGWRPKKPPKDDTELWLGAVGGLVDRRAWTARKMPPS